MAISRLSFIRATLILLACGMVALVAIVGTSIWLVNRTQAYTEAVVKARTLRSRTVDLLTVVQDAETGQRGYLLTGDDAYLAPFEAAKTAITLREQRLEAAADAFQDPATRAEVGRLVPIIDRKVAELSETIALKNAGRTDDALAIVRSDAGKQLMDEARAIFAKLVTTAEDRLNDGLADQRGSAQTLWWTVVGGGLFILAVTLAGSMAIVRYTRELTAAQSELKELAAGLEERIKERTADLSRANEEVQRFAYIVTHDLRAPLVNIMGFTSELEASIADLQKFVATLPPDIVDPSFVDARRAAEEDVPEALGFIRSSTRKMDGLINAILKLSREGRRTLKPETLSLDALLRNASETIAHQLTENGGRIEIASQVPTLICDRLALEQIIGNLLDNAVKYRAPERSLLIRVTANMASRGRVVIDIADNGRGIAEQDHERVFELFRRSGTQNTAGEGIGLAYVRTLVRRLGGDVKVSSRFGQGTTFTVDLPRDVRAFVGSESA
ncbi:sensor histidine kinase [Ancylobacter terrae]|uniref:sensor histidine kinase n=1 Tax=Ancylobacter sp. sgz301288 TaxID=3342077 RepID=UPI00385B6B97